MAVIRETPVVSTAKLSQRLGGVAFKLENLQRTGSFNRRGAVSKLAACRDTAGKCGVVAASARNHGLGVALAAREIGTSATVFVSRGAAAVKCERIAALGGRVVRCPGDYDATESTAVTQS